MEHRGYWGSWHGIESAPRRLDKKEGPGLESWAFGNLHAPLTSGQPPPLDCLRTRKLQPPPDLSGPHIRAASRVRGLSRVRLRDSSYPFPAGISRRHPHSGIHGYHHPTGTDYLRTGRGRRRGSKAFLLGPCVLCHTRQRRPLQHQRRVQQQCRFAPCIPFTVQCLSATSTPVPPPTNTPVPATNTPALRTRRNAANLDEHAGSTTDTDEHTSSAIIRPTPTPTLLPSVICPDSQTGGQPRVPSNRISIIDLSSVMEEGECDEVRISVPGEGPLLR